jgi:uncharacterized membrane protein (UPF0127 family)
VDSDWQKVKWDSGPPRLRDLTRRAAWVLLVIGLCGFLVDGASRAARPSLLPPGGQVTESGLKAFGARLFTVVPGPGLKGSASPHCALYARTPAQVAQGLKGQPSLGPFAGMLFGYSHPVTGSFSEDGIDLALSVAWFDSQGRFIASANARPCPSRQACVAYSAGRPYLSVLAVRAGQLAGLGIGPGSHIQAGGPCSG